LRASRELRCNNLLIISWGQEEIIHRNGKKITIVEVAFKSEELR